MKVIFLENVPHVGRKHEIKDISGGYARNYLVPRKLATFANKSNEKMIDGIQKREEARKSEREKNLSESIDRISGETVQFSEKASESGSLFAGIGRDELGVKIFEDTGIELDTEYILLEKPIKNVGEHSVLIGTKEKNVEILVKVEQESK